MKKSGSASLLTSLNKMRRSFYYAAICSVTFSLLVTEIMLSAIFQVLIGANNTVTAISVALVGLASAGIAVYVLPRLRGESLTERTACRLLAASTLTMLLMPVLLMQLPINHGEFSFSLTATTSFYLLLVYVIAIAPFFMGGLVLNVLLYHGAHDVARLYGADLIGASIGCLIATACFERFSAPASILLSTLPAMTVLLWRAAKPVAFGLLLLLVALLILARTTLLLDVKQFSTMNEVRNPSYQSFPVSKGDVDFQSWALDAWTIIRNQRIPQQWQNFKGWGVSSTYTGPIPDLRMINFNLRFSTYATRFNGDFVPIRQWLDSDIISLHYLLERPYDRVLVVGAGGGREVLNALNHDAKEVTAIDISNVVINDLMKGELEQFSGGLYKNPRVHAQVDEGRSYIRRQQGKYNLIEFTIVGGANLEKLDMLRQEDLFTVEAVSDYLDHLEPNGMLSYVMYSTRGDLLSNLRANGTLVSPPYIPAVQMLTALKKVIEQHPGSKLEDHVLVAALPGVIDKSFELVHIIVSNDKFSPAEREQFARLSKQLNFPVMYPADNSGDNFYRSIIAAQNVDQVNRDLPFSIQPPTDERPFIYAFEPRHYFAGFPANFKAVLANPVMEKTLLLLIVTLAFLIVPVLWRGPANRESFTRSIVPQAIYFGCLGMAYMILEMTTIMKLNLYLGKPVYGLAVGLFAFLLATGLGSLTAQRYSTARLLWTGRFIVLFIITYGIAFAALWPKLSLVTITISSFWRCFVAVGVVFPLAFPMGMLFPLAMRSIATTERHAIPWFWSINGITSVLGLLLTRGIALLFGLTVATAAALAIYGLAAVCLAGFAARETELLPQRSLETEILTVE
jgi:Spermine/spermidine synthase domain